ncbi:hypothetical protein [Flavobacterium pectinovorum]|uniref:Uncharacterized protein n=1 Tax=Flavobacterium pectinovorum TaxID=29533 RepID=A0A502EF15_9FLAO|nr:hypothetical protein [Flavobacterium pectinovorum]TPG36293.1 hypothetical protein EAH81_19670 [Flavobacterium pectinovorum]
MLEQIILNYKKFADCLIKEVDYFNFKSNDDQRSIEITMSCLNFQNENKKEIIKVIFKGLKLLKFIRVNDYPSLFLDEVYISNENGLITFDFFPIGYVDYLEENPNSTFIIRCKEVLYEVLLRD